MDGQVPASANAQVGPFGDEVDESVGAACSLFALNQLGEGFGGSVGRVVVDDEDVEGEAGLLGQGRGDGVLDGAHAVAYGDDNACLDGHFLAVKHDLVVLAGCQVGVDLAEVARYGALHFHLACAVAWVNVVELALAAQAGVGLHLGVEVLADVERQHVAREEEPQVVEAGVVVGVEHPLLEVLLQALGAQEQQRAHGKVVAHAAQLVVDEGPVLALSVGQQGVVVGIDQRGPAVVGNGDQSGQCLVAQFQWPGLHI